MCIYFDQLKQERNQVVKYIDMAKQEENNAAYERQDALEESRRKKLNAIKNMSQIATKTAASNLSINSSTALNLMQDEKQSGDLDAFSLIDKAERRAVVYTDRANSYYNHARLLRSVYTKDLINQSVKAALFVTDLIV